MSGEDIKILFFAIVCFVVVPYFLIIRRSLAAHKSVIPYVVLVGLHVLGACLYFGSFWSDRSSNDAAGRGLSSGLSHLYYIAANIGVTFVAWVVFLARKRLDAMARDRQRWD